MRLMIKKFLLIALFFEIILFLMLYYFGPNGSRRLADLEFQKKILQQEITVMNQKISVLEQEIGAAQKDFAKEKIARERLFMKKDNEIVYFKK